jgi:hypothetical protein
MAQLCMPSVPMCVCYTNPNPNLQPPGVNELGSQRALPLSKWAMRFEMRVRGAHKSKSHSEIGGLLLETLSTARRLSQSVIVAWARQFCKGPQSLYHTAN